MKLPAGRSTALEKFLRDTFSIWKPLALKRMHRLRMMVLALNSMSMQSFTALLGKKKGGLPQKHLTLAPEPGLLQLLSNCFLHYASALGEQLLVGPPEKIIRIRP